MDTPDPAQQNIYTIGHSTHPIQAFIEMLQEQGIRTLVDVRRYPGSNKYPQYNQQNLKESLESAQISYLHMEALGGRRKGKKNSANTRWRNTSFRAYADYMESAEFESGAQDLMEIGSRAPTAYMCSEAVWWRCHRALISDYLKIRGWQVFHILPPRQISEHPFTSAARVHGQQLSYQEPQQKDN